MSLTDIAIQKLKPKKSLYSKTVDYSYDEISELLEEKITEEGKTSVINYTYDASGNL